MSKIFLVHVPLTDPTQPCHGLAYLVPTIRLLGHEVVVRDLNAELVDHLTYSDQVKGMLEIARERIKEIESKPAIGLSDQLYALRYLVEGVPQSPAEVEQATAVFRDPIAFFDDSKYAAAQITMERWLNLISLLSNPARYRFHNLETPNLNPYSFAELTNVGLQERTLDPFLGFYRTFVNEVAEVAPDVFGLSVTYRAQMLHALVIARLVKHQCPNTKILMGGTGVSAYARYSRDFSLWQPVFQYVDGICAGEGEPFFGAYLKSLEDGNQIEQVPGLVSPRNGKIMMTPPTYVDLNSLPTPDYDDFPWPLYLAPYPFVGYSPTRGCYWNKCTFCDYGLANGTPTAPWRQRSVPLILDDLEDLTPKYPFMYFAVDVLAPAMVVRLAEGMIERDISLSWCADFRLESYYTSEHCQTLKKAGCTVAVFGLESASQRILDLIDKGTRSSDLERIITDFSNAGIGVQVSSFLHFPSETYQEARMTIDFIRATRRHWMTALVGNFSLTGNSIVAKIPARFGIKEVRPFDNSDVSWELNWNGEEAAKTSEQVDQLSREQIKVANPQEYPFKGSYATPHTVIDVATNGPRRLRMSNPKRNNGTVVNGRIVKSAIEFEQLVEFHYQFLRLQEIRKAQSNRLADAASFIDDSRQHPTMILGDSYDYFVSNAGWFTRLNPAESMFLAAWTDGASEHANRISVAEQLKLSEGVIERAINKLWALGILTEGRNGNGSTS